MTSASFTEAAHARNIEAGLLIADAITASDLRNQFEALVRSGALRKVPELD